MKSLVRRFLKDQTGATAIEYGLVAGIVSIAIVVALTLMAAPLEALYVNIRDGVRPPASEMSTRAPSDATRKSSPLTSCSGSTRHAGNVIDARPNAT